jgi:hypothetical protein
MAVELAAMVLSQWNSVTLDQPSQERRWPPGSPEQDGEYYQHILSPLANLALLLLGLLRQATARSVVELFGSPRQGSPPGKNKAQYITMCFTGGVLGTKKKHGSVSDVNQCHIPLSAPELAKVSVLNNEFGVASRIG